MYLQNNYKDILNALNNNPLPNRIPVSKYLEFDYDIYHYYNQYGASPRTRQNRRIMRNSPFNF